jgi:polyphosphate kinase
VAPVANEHEETVSRAHRQRSLPTHAQACPPPFGVKANVTTKRYPQPYEASQNGVRVDCTVRVPPSTRHLSQRQHPCRVGRFLEHHRVYMFFNGGDPLYYVGSTDEA